ncbi:asparagine synthase (glutamine-hydrolyzing) [Streptomyces litchfieldiae]|uniref:asparagine synthase (glutamine-hydrolyzing) n=1 Tax=Streptomyces litchfieldiae TaxID=3075543 RepID=A0ABU2N1D5_9ACTN|nr:asparagine synthase (glutamine-hydrolyzing) [Streptomyces sp. DSM 44938]MDT0346883.1 asparagine synthase (glutamine-hydrolyzing) [Streptomyces sp. DSM 44938]
MCRIYGYFNATATPHELRTVAALQRHGGPDSTGSARADGWGVGNNRLAIVDLDGGRQPYDLDGRITVVFNGEIYNHDELRRNLRRLGYSFPDRCDGGILPALYDAYGESFVDLLDGMYSIAVLDRRAEPKLLLATDHIGMKPLYYRWDPAERSLHFSSEIPALLAFRPLSGAVWAPGLDAYLASKTPFGERTMFEDVQVLPPATTMVCELGGVPRAVRREPDRARPVAADETAAGATVREQLRAEVGRLLVADVPVAVITSGGLDSSLVTVLAAEYGPLHSFNIAYRGSWPFDERRFARQAAERAGATYHQVEIDPATFPDLIEDVVWHLGQPNADPITLSTHALFAAVREAGFKVALTGDAADEVFGGYARMHAAARAAAAGEDWYPGYLDALAVLPKHRRYGLYTDEYRAFTRGTPALPAEALDLLRDGGGTALERITEFELGYRLPAYHLRRVDHLSMASSVEVRLPFCQRSVVRAGRHLPDHLRIGDGKVKRTLYAAAAGLLPDAVLNRPKQPFTLPITDMLTPGWPLWDFARDLLSTPRLRAGGQLEPGAVQGLFAAQADRPDDTVALTLWALLVHEVWREQFSVVARRAEPVAVAA